MPISRFVEYEDAPAEVRAVYDDIMESRNVKWVNNFWKALAQHPPQRWHNPGFCTSSIKLVNVFICSTTFAGFTIFNLKIVPASWGPLNLFDWFN